MKDKAALPWLEHWLENMKGFRSYMEARFPVIETGDESIAALHLTSKVMIRLLGEVIEKIRGDGLGVKHEES